MNPPPMVPTYQAMQDAQHLKLLSIFYYVMGGLSCIGSLLGGFYIFMGTVVSRMLATATTTTSGSRVSTAPPAEFGWIFTTVGIFIAVFCIAMGIACVLTGRWLSARKHKTFCMVVAGVNCLHVPLGTTLGVFTFLVLSRPSVDMLFGGQSPLTTPHA